jgi:hypothetical protein
MRWVEAHEEFRHQYARAREALYDWIAEEAIRIADDSSGDYFIEDRNGQSVVVPDHARVQRARLQVDTRKWLLSKLAPRKYGDKVELLAASSDGPNELKISWQTFDPIVRPNEGPPAPRQITYQPHPLPADLAPEDWDLLNQVLALIKRTIPSDDDSPPAEILAVMRDALLTHFREQAETSSV